MMVLTRYKGNRKETCCGYGKSKDNVFLMFENTEKGYDFKTAKSAWWHWYRYRESYPEDCNGWFAKVEIR